MKQRTVYIASSWRNAHGVELLTDELRRMGLFVTSWVEHNFLEDHNQVAKDMDFETWVHSPFGRSKFDFDTAGAMNCDLFIYYAPAGQDACCELGLAWREAQMEGRDMVILGLWAKGEGIGLMRRMVDKWFSRPADLIRFIKEKYAI